jgi:hypothetical protein
VRWLSLVLGAITVWATYRLGRIVLPDGRWLALAGAAVVAFTPQFVFLHSSVNNDNLATTLSSLLLLGTAQALTAPTRDRDWAWMGLLLGLGALTKYSVFALAPLPFGVVAWLAWKERSWRPALRRLLWLVALPLIIAGWWYVRNQVVYGDPLAWQVMLSSLGKYVARSTPFAWADLREFVVLTFTTYWARFGWMSLPLPTGIYVVLAMVCCLGVVGISLDLWKHRRESPPLRWLLLLAVLAVSISVLRYLQTINNSGYQGRFFFPVISALSLLLLLGLSSLLGARWAHLTGAGLSAGLFVLAVGSLGGILYPAYAPSELYAPTSLAGLPQPCLRFGDEIELAAYQVQPAPLRPGDDVDLILFWHAMANSTHPLTVTVELDDLDHLPLDRDVSSASEWHRRDLFSTTHRLRVPGDASPAAATLAIRAAHKSPLPVFTLGGRLLGESAELSGLKIAPPAFHRTPQHPTTSSFGEVAALRGYDLDTARARTGGALTLALHWESLGETSFDYSLFVHLLDGEGQPVTQADGGPLDGSYPTNLWSVGEWIVDPRQLSLENVPPGDYRLGVGWYLWQTGERLPATDRYGHHWPADTAILEQVHVTGEGPQ